MIIANAGMVVPPKTPVALADGMCQLMQIDAGAMTDFKLRARARIVENFSIPLLIHRTREILFQPGNAAQPKSLQPCLPSA
jgi:glycosyltransferase involved in cell wall biosynthesis